MKRTFYPLLSLLFASMFALGLSAKAQSYLITFPNADPTDQSAGGPLDKNDGVGGIETGVRFYVTQPGTITGIRFLKGVLNTGVHIGHLWSNSGTKLAQATFSESPSGWQEVAVSVHITNATYYVASVFNDVGDYSNENQTWADQGGSDYGTVPIKVVAYSNDPAHNGVYVYTNNPTGSFPNQDGGADNYWVGIRFVPDFSLPVSLIDFSATTASSDISLNWKTTSETNNRGFEIERSNNGADWYALNFVNGAGESTTVKNYAYTDKGLAPGTYYYRLKQTDFDGKSKISPVISATVSGKAHVSLFQNFPNPFSGTTAIRFDLPNAQKARLSIFDMSGREVKVLVDKTSEAGSHLVSFDAKGLSRQIYSIRLKTESGVFTKQILVQ